MPSAATRIPKRAWLHVWPVVAICCWLLAAFCVWLWTTKYEFTTYQPAAAYSHSEWPNQSALDLDDNRHTLVFFLHPKCPCTRASIRELHKLLSSSSIPSQDRPQLIVVASHPADAPADWYDTDILQLAADIPDAEVFLDPNGQETSRFGAVTSGTVMLFDTDGSRLFAGGITASRGHEGDSAGGHALRTLLTGRTGRTMDSTPVFGCKVCTPLDKPD